MSTPSTPPATSLKAQESLSQKSIDTTYRPFLNVQKQPNEGVAVEEEDWVEQLELDSITKLHDQFGRKLKILVLYGSLRQRSFSRLTAYEAARILTKIGADVRVFDPKGLPIKDDTSDQDPKVQELRSLSEWSDGHVWVCPEQHGTITAVFKNQIDWIPLSVGSVRPTQGRTLAVFQVNGGSQSFNVVNILRTLGRWMRMFTIPNQSSIPKAWTCFSPSDRLLPSSNRDRVVDVCEELVKTSLILSPHFDSLNDRYSEREEKRQHGRLRTQEEAEKAKKVKEAEEEAKRASKEKQEILKNM